MDLRFLSADRDPLLPAGICWPMRCGPGADQGDHDHGWLRSRAVRGRLRRSVLSDRGRDGLPCPVGDSCLGGLAGRAAGLPGGLEAGLREVRLR